MRKPTKRTTARKAPKSSARPAKATAATLERRLAKVQAELTEERERADWLSRLLNEAREAVSADQLDVVSLMAGRIVERLVDIELMTKDLENIALSARAFADDRHAKANLDALAAKDRELCRLRREALGCARVIQDSASTYACAIRDPKAAAGVRKLADPEPDAAHTGRA